MKIEITFDKKIKKEIKDHCIQKFKIFLETIKKQLTYLHHLQKQIIIENSTRYQATKRGQEQVIKNLQINGKIEFQSDRTFRPSHFATMEKNTQQCQFVEKENQVDLNCLKQSRLRHSIDQMKQTVNYILEKVNYSDSKFEDFKNQTTKQIDNIHKKITDKDKQKIVSQRNPENKPFQDKFNKLESQFIQLKRKSQLSMSDTTSFIESKTFFNPSSTFTSTLP